MISQNPLQDSLRKSGVKGLVLGFPKCGTTAFAEWLNSSSSIELSKPKESYQFCPEFNDIQQPFSITWNDNEETALRIEACTWNIYSSQLLECLSELPEIKVFIIVRDINEVFPSWVKQVEKAGFGSLDEDNSVTFWDTQKEISGLKDGKELLSDYRTTLCYGYWVKKWISALGSDRVLLIRNNELRNEEQTRQLSKLIDNFLGQNCNLPSQVGEKNTYSNKRFPAFKFLYRSRLLKKLWFSVEGIKTIQKPLVITRYFIKERILMKKAPKKSFALDFMKSDDRFQQEMTYLEKAFGDTRGIERHDT
ncbi:MAG: sulfotransferase domain-containing protein [Thiotrichales bacterium]